jgi:ParB-like nuclease domain
MSEVTSIDKNEAHDNATDNISEIIAPKPLTVKDEYASLVPQISEQEYQTIRQSIKDNGQWVPIITNPQLIILDGHTRSRACKELGLESRIMVREFEDPLLEKQFIIQINRNRRQLTPFQRIELECKYDKIQSELAKKRMSEAGKIGAEKRWKESRKTDEPKESSSTDRVRQNYTTPSNVPMPAGKTGRAIDISAKNAQVSPATYNKGKKIIKIDPSQEILNKLRIGEISIDKAYGQLKTKQKPQQQIAAQQKGKSTIIDKTYSKTDPASSDGVNRLHDESNQNEFAESKKESTVTPSLNDGIESQDLTDRKKEIFLSHIPVSFANLQKDMDTVSQLTNEVGNIFFEVSINLGTREVEIKFCGITQQKNATTTSTGKGVLEEAN